jgi:hypothetical protein
MSKIIIAAIGILHYCDQRSPTTAPRFLFLVARQSLLTQSDVCMHVQYLVCQTHPCTSEIQTELTRYILLISIDLTSVSDDIRSFGVL